MRGLAATLAVVFALAPLRSQDVRSQGAPVPRSTVIVIDAGHGGEDVGVRSPSGVEEKQLTLEVAQTLKSRIEAALGLRVIMTRDDDRLLTADERAAAANASGGGLFISLHANAAPAAAVSGAEVYYQALDPSGVDASLADTFFIPWERAQARHHELSARAAGIVQEELQQAATVSPHPPRPAFLRPLVGVNMPAVLVEMLYLTNSEQDQTVVEIKERVATALAASVDRFLAAAASFGPQ